MFATFSDSYVSLQKLLLSYFHSSCIKITMVAFLDSLKLFLVHLIHSRILLHPKLNHVAVSKSVQEVSRMKQSQVFRFSKQVRNSRQLIFNSCMTRKLQTQFMMETSRLVQVQYIQSVSKLVARFKSFVRAPFNNECR